VYDNGGREAVRDRNNALRVSDTINASRRRAQRTSTAAGHNPGVETDRRKLWIIWPRLAQLSVQWKMTKKLLMQSLHG
jgi:hypothetical protein